MAENDLPVNYETVLADLIARRDKLNAAIAGIEAMIGIAPSAGWTITGGQAPPGTAGVVPPPVSAVIESDTFFNMSVPDATRKLLRMRKRPQTTQEIASALENGGVLHNSVRFSNTVGAVLTRIDKAGGDIVKVERAKFGLAEWYPGKRKRSQRDEPEGPDELTDV